MSPPVSWYECIEGRRGLEQGDILFSVPFLIPREDSSTREILVDIEEYDGIVISQSCDIENEKIDVVLICPLISLNEIAPLLAGSTHPHALLSAKNKIRKGEFVHYHLINKCEIEGHQMDYFVVDLKNPRSITLERINEIAHSKSDRLRLISPYREHLSQTFARVFMRIGLPSDIPEFTE
jgi:hypothetical protein